MALQKAIYGLFGNITRNEFITILDVLSDINKESLTAALQSVVAHDTHIFSAAVMARKFKPADLSRTARAFKDKDDDLYKILFTFTKTLKDDAEKLLEIRSKTGSFISDAQFIELQQYLRCLEVFAMRPVKAFLPIDPTEDIYMQYKSINNMLQAQNIVVQPGLRFYQSEIVRNLMEHEEIFRKLDTKSKDKIRTMFLNGVYGLMQEDIILYETMQQCKKYGMMDLYDNYWPRYSSLPILAYKAIFPKDEISPQDKEIDMIIENYNEDQFFLIEIKHSQERNENQSKWLVNDDIIDRITSDRKKIVCQAVLYRGQSCSENNISYVNIQEYLHILHNDGIESAMQLLLEK